MYETIIRDIDQSYYNQNYSNNGQRFVAWYLRQIHGLDLSQTKDSITDGAGDKHIDAIVIDDENSTAYIIQGKFIGSESVDSEPLREILASWIRLKDMVKLQEDANEKLQKKLSELALAIEDDYDIAFELVTTSALTASAIRDLDAFQREIAESDELAASLSVIDSEELQRRYELRLEKDDPIIIHRIMLQPGKYISLNVSGTDVILASIPLKDCLLFPGIKNGSLFQKNVRQSLGLNNRVNKGIKSTIYGDRYHDFFFYHNGITAICNEMKLNDQTGELQLKGLSVVNGCQSLNTILSCSERVKAIDASIMFRFYEIPQRERADRISISTNSQSTVKPRDLRSNDKRILMLKRSFEQQYPHGYMITKRGEEAPAHADKSLTIDLSLLGKCLMAWHSQRPNISYSETKIFDKYFEQLFKRNYSPVNVQALNSWIQTIQEGWTARNPFDLNDSLLAMKSFGPYHHLYAVSICYSIGSKHPETVPVPSPSGAWEHSQETNTSDGVILMAATCLNSALESAANKPQPRNRVFSPQNWMKTKACLDDINAAARMYITMLPNMPGGRELREALALPSEYFEERWAAD